jgi:hypothetical protein
VGALTDKNLGKFVNEHFVCSFQKVGTFKIVNGQKQGGNVATYFCAPDGRVLHAVAGPVDGPTMLAEARWVVDTLQSVVKETNGDAAKFKAGIRKAHAEKLKAETGLAVEAITWDPPEASDPKDALTFKDPSGRDLAPKLPPPPINGPDVTLEEKNFDALQKAAHAAPGARYVECGVRGDGKGGRRVVVNNQAVVSQLLAAHALVKIETVYGTVFESVLGEKVSTKPVDVVSPFPWVDKDGKKQER